MPDAIQQGPQKIGNWGGGGGGEHIYVFGFTNRENNQFQKKLMRIRIRGKAWMSSVSMQ